MVKLINLEENHNVKTAEEKGIFKIMEHSMNYNSKTPDEARDNFYLNQAGVHKKQLMIELKDELVSINSGSLQFMTGNINVKTNVKGISDYIGKRISSKLIGEEIIKPTYSGTGYIMLKPTYKYIILEEIKGDEGIVISDGNFLACTEGLKLKAISMTNLSSAALGREGIFNLLVKGDGVVSFTSPQHKSDIILVYLVNDVLKINGDHAIAWSEKLKFTVEPMSSSLFGNVVTEESVLNVYRGTGIIWVASENL